MIAQAPAIAAIGTPRHHYAAFAVMVALAALAQGAFGIYPVFLAKVLCFALFACAFNLLIGFVGLLSFGHAAFWGSAAYASAHAAAKWGLPPELCILFAAFVAAALGAVIGGFAIRRQGIYFAMITLAFAQMIFFIALQAKFTGGEDGLQIPTNYRRIAFGFLNLRDNATLFWFVLGIFLIGFLVIYRVIHSPFGQVLKAIRENQPRAISLGYHVDRYKLVAFVLSAALAGLAGGTKVFVTGSAALTDVNWPMSGEVVLMALLGGMGTIFGPVAGAVVLITIEEFLAERAGAWVSVIQGGIFVLCVLAFRRGIVGELARLLKKPL
ncbi:MAG: branched-chain amino acid ABC transporter permease [Candidatus Odyssella sp.]|nr:branched-chain amino acid ABC transporter permease [Candidatus Odyssella sp.]